MIDMHAHWRPAEFTDALRARTTGPRIVKNQDGVEVLTTRMGGEEPLSTAFDEVDFHLARMDRQGVSTSVLSLLGSFCWIEAQPLEISLALCRLFNDSVSKLSQASVGRIKAQLTEPPFSAPPPLPFLTPRASNFSTVPKRKLVAKRKWPELLLARAKPL